MSDRYTVRKLLSLCLLSSAASVHAAERSAIEQISDEAERQGEPVELYQGPKLIEPAAPRFPSQNLRRAREGWVYLNFMVSTEGRPYEIFVADSSGNPAYERAAIEAVQRTRYEPARGADGPLDASSELKIQFALEGATGARRNFIRRFRKVVNAINAGDQAVARELLSKLEEMQIQSLYEDAYLGLLQALYRQRWGSPVATRKALQRAIAYEEREGYLTAALFAQALRMALAVELELKNYVRVLELIELLEKQGDQPELAAKLEQTRVQIEDLRTSDQAYAVDGVIGSNYSWNLPLLKSRFHFQHVEGRIAEIKLRCQRDYVFFRFDPEQEYRISDSQGQCQLEVVGDPNSQFELIQR